MEDFRQGDNPIGTASRRFVRWATTPVMTVPAATAATDFEFGARPSWAGIRW